MADRADEKRSGDVLGLGEDVVGRYTTGPAYSSEDSTDSETVRRRRRMREGADSLTSGTSDVQRSPGATGIDMGAGGEGTDVE